MNLAFREAIDRCIRIHPDVTIIAGDLFHTVRPSNAVITFAFRELRRLAEGTKAPIVLIAGNHESPRRSDSGSLLRLFGEIPGMCVSDSRAERFDFPELELSVACLPHAALSDAELQPPRVDDRRRFNVLVIHAQVDQRLITDFGGVTLNLSRVQPHEWDYIALGHVHSRLDVALNAAYAGAVEHTAANIWLGSRENKGFLEVELPSGKRTFHELTSPREIVVLPPIDGLYLEANEIFQRITQQLEGVAGGIDGKLVRLELQNVSREQFRALDHRALRAYRTRALNLSLEVRPPVAAEAGSRKGPTLRRSLQDELTAFAAQRPGASVRAPRLVQTVERILQQIEHGEEQKSE